MIVVFLSYVSDSLQWQDTVTRKGDGFDLTAYWVEEIELKEGTTMVMARPHVTRQQQW